MISHAATLARSGRTGRILAALLLIALTTACAQFSPRDTAEIRRVFADGIGALDERYIHPIRPGDVMMTGLSQISAIDENLTVTRTPKSVVLSQEGVIVAGYPSPTDKGIDQWADLGARVLTDARRVSPAFSSYSREELLDSVFQGLVNGLDRYSRYLTPEDARNSRASREGFGGIGIKLDRVDGEYVIRTAFPDQPATAAGLRPDDKITHIDGQPVRNLPLFDVVNKLRGRVGDAVKITLVRSGFPGAFDRKIIRDYIVAATVDVRQHGRILEVRLSGFNSGTRSALRQAIVKAARRVEHGLQGVVLDLRGNPGGLLEQAIAVSDLFLTKGRIISTKGRHPQSNQLFDASPGEVLPGVPMVVIVNGRSASAAEIVAVALRDAGRAAIVGSTSFGKGSVQTIIPLSNQGELNVTWARIFAPSGQTLDAQGIVPAICTNVSRERMEKTLAALTAAGNSSALDPAQLRFQARQPHYSDDGRTACMPTDRQEPDDLRAARLLISNKITYAAAVSRPAPAIAER